MSMNTLWFKWQLQDRDMTQAKLAGLLGMNKSAVSLMLRGHRKMTMDEASKFAAILGVPLEEVFEAAGLKSEIPGERAVEVASYVDFEGKVIDSPGLGRISAPVYFPDKTIGIRFHTANTPQDGFDGWVAFYRPTVGVSADCWGRLCVVTTQKGDKLLRFVRRGYRIGEYNLASFCGNVSESETISDAAPILGFRL